MRSLKFQPVVSTALVVVNVIVFAVCNFTGDLLYDAGCLDIYNVLERR